jgi:hypothetical protein
MPKKQVVNKDMIKNSQYENRLIGKNTKESCRVQPMQYPVTAIIAASDNPGIIMVSCNGNPPVPARLISGIDRQELAKKENAGREVLVVFNGGNPELPIITGIMENVLEDLVSMEIVSDPIEKAPVKTVVDKKQILIEAENEIVLQCGLGSIILRKDGKIVIKGTRIMSRASGTNKVKGSSVSLN